MLDVRKLLLLRELARRDTIAAVAEALCYTPSAVSQQLAALERDAGVPLLQRTGRRVSLTPAGAALAGQTEEILALLERAAAGLAAARTGLTGPLRIGAFPTAMRTILPAALVALGRDHPGLELMVTELDPAAVPDALRSGALDVALVHEYEFVPAPRDPALDTEPLLEEAIYLASARPAPMMDEDAAGEEAASEEAASEDPVGRHRDSPWIMASPGTLCHTMAVRACQAAGFTPRIRHHADDFVTVLALVAAEQGVALVPQLGAIGPPPGVVLTELPARRRTRIAYRNGTRHHPPVSACIAAIHAAADTHRVGRRP
ncbi:MAG: LysR family transcriptional regulator [Streptosporangiaceae bacterium]